MTRVQPCSTELTITDAAGSGAASPPAAYRPLGLAPLLRAATAGHDLAPTAGALTTYVDQTGDPDALLDLSLVLQLQFQQQPALEAQKEALNRRRLFSLRKAAAVSPRLRLLVLKSPGTLMANTPLECLLEGAEIDIDVLYLDGEPNPGLRLPAHDLVFVAACGSDENARVLEQIAGLIGTTSAPVLNRPRGIALTLRESAYALLGAAPGIRMAHTRRFERRQLLHAAAGAIGLSDRIAGDYPFIVRPVGSHAGRGLVKLDDREALGTWVETESAAHFYVAPFIDYRSRDGLYRKYRIVLIGGRPFLCHMGISQDWMVHYPYPEMIAHPERRDEEARAMAEFDHDFVGRHGDAMREIAARTGLDYVGFDGAETPDGRLLVFEIATGMVVHDTDDPALFPYKLPQMRRVFAAFQAMLRHRVETVC